MCLSHESTIYSWNSQELVVKTTKSWEKNEEQDIWDLENERRSWRWE